MVNSCTCIVLTMHNEIKIYKITLNRDTLVVSVMERCLMMQHGEHIRIG